MSLADLYKDGADLSGSGNESEEDFVPSEASASDDNDDGSDSDDQGAEEASDSGSSPVQQEEREEREEHKRRIEAIAQEMLAPVGPRKVARTAGTQRADPGDSKGKEPADKEPAATPPAAGGPGPSAPKHPARRPSKFSKMAEQAEKRRAAKGNTLDAARKAWAGFVADEGLRDELDRANKDGYVERQQFLGRVDRRMHERSRGPGK